MASPSDVPLVGPHPASLEEQALLKDCKVRRQRRSGPGGQHRNKVETAVVITHGPTGLRGEASERRSQEENRSRALFRLRLELAVKVRCKVEPSRYTVSELWRSRCRSGRVSVNPEHAEFPAILAEALDVLSASKMDAKAASECLGCSTSQFIKLLQLEPQSLISLNEHRRAAGQPVYR